MLEGKFDINKEFILKWQRDDDGTLDVYIVPVDPARSVFHGVIYSTDDGGYTKYEQDSDKAKEVVSDLVSKDALPIEYVLEAKAAKEQKEIDKKTERISQLENELAALKAEVETSELVVKKG